MKECFGKVYLVNGDIKNCSEFDSSLVNEGEIFYEVIRITEGVPLFFDDHLDRLWNSIKSKYFKTQLSSSLLKEWTFNLINNQDIENGNIKIVLNLKGSSFTTVVYFVMAVYPDENLYKRGADTIVYFGERNNPTVKILNLSLRSTIQDQLMDSGAYEAILVNSSKCITEGSRSNIFFIKDKEVITAPDDEVLCGITRKYIIKLCSDLNIPLKLYSLPLDQLDSIDSAFISGTSPQLLAIRRIDERLFKVDNMILRTLSEGFREIVTDYVENNQTT